jgi:hypothetical protein
MYGCATRLNRRYFIKKKPNKSNHKYSELQTSLPGKECTGLPNYFAKDFKGHHHHKHKGLGHLARSVSRVTAALSTVSSVSQPFSFLVGCSGMILKGFCFVAFFAGVKASSFYIPLSFPVYIQCAVRGVWSRLFYGR